MVVMGLFIVSLCMWLSRCWLLFWFSVLVSIVVLGVRLKCLWWWWIMVFIRWKFSMIR